LTVTSGESVTEGFFHRVDVKHFGVAVNHFVKAPNDMLYSGSHSNHHCPLEHNEVISQVVGEHAHGKGLE
jgi:hypothetical protein